MDKQVQKLTQEYEEYAKKNGFKLNPNKKLVENIIKMLLKKSKSMEKNIVPAED